MNYHDLYECDMNNGKGARVTLFVSGCNHGCKGCYNTETWPVESGKPFTKETSDHIISLLKDEKMVRQGISLSGGDPLHPANVKEIFLLLSRVKAECPDKDIWLWSGSTKEEIDAAYYSDDKTEVDVGRAMILGMCDVFIDGKFEQDLHKANLRWKGSENQIIHNFTNIEI